MKLKRSVLSGSGSGLGVALIVMIAGCGLIKPQPGKAGASSAAPAVVAKETEATPGKVGLAEAAGVVVAEFEGGSVPPDKKTDFWGRAIASFIGADLGASANLKVIDRARLVEVLREQSLSMSDLSDRETQLRIGAIVGAKYFVFGTYTIVGATAALTARMDSVETGGIVESRSVTGKPDDLRELSRQLSVAFLAPLDATVAERESRETLAAGDPAGEAARYFAQGLADERRGDYEGAVDMYTQAMTVSPHYPGAREHLEKVSELAARQ
jgi:hypothetical protein